jgi:chromosome segregation ATPase
MNKAVAALILGAAVPGGVDTSSTLLTVLGSLVIGVLGTVVAVWRFRKLGDKEKDQMSSDAADKAVSALDKALARYVQDLEAALVKVAHLERELGSANRRINVLEGQLRAAEGKAESAEKKAADYMALRVRFDEALEARRLLERDLTDARARLNELEVRIGGRREADSESDRASRDTGNASR